MANEISKTYSNVEARIQENWDHVRAEIELACARVGRNPEEVTLIAVGKTKPVAMLKAAYEAGARQFGENKVQEMVDKQPKLPEDIRWHMIGHLQRNKVKYVVGKTALIHSVDSLRLAEEISREAVKQGVLTDVLIEVNVAEEESKFGVTLTEAEALIREASRLPGIRIKGLMTIAPYVEIAEQNRPYFRKLRQFAVDMTEKNIDNVSMNVLSMGMTGDYVVAVEEGATCVRVGTGIFGERDYSVK